MAFLPDTTRKQAADVVVRMMDRRRQESIAHARSPTGQVTVSIGVAMPEHRCGDNCIARLPCRCGAV